MSLTIDQVVRQTGLTSRALRFYEARGLLKPLRTASGRRLFDSDELARVHQIVTLKKAGLSLMQIGRLIDRKALNMETLIRDQIDHLDAQARQIEVARATLKAALSRIEGGAPLDAETLCALIRDGDRIMMEEKWMAVIDRYYTPEQQAHWREHVMPQVPELSQEAYHRQWQALSGRIEAALPLDHGSDQALAFVREWFTLLEPFSKIATEQMWLESREFYAGLPDWEKEVDPGFSSAVWNFILQATKAARAAGKDIGPAPAWMLNQKSVDQYGRE